MTTTYPSDVDDLTSLPRVSNGTSSVVASDINKVRDAVVAVEAELGKNPSGTFGTLKDRLDQNDTTISSNLTAGQINIADTDGYFASGSVEGALKELSIGMSSSISGLVVKIGAAEEGSYTDGLFNDFTPNTRLGVAIDRINEVLGSLAPSAAPNFSTIGYNTNLGVAGKVSFGASNPIATYVNVGSIGGGTTLDKNDTFDSMGGISLRKGIYAASPTIVRDGYLASDVSISSSLPTASYPARSFGDGDRGLLQLWLNNVKIHEIDLSSFGSGSTLNGSGSGFTSLSAATPVKFSNGSNFDTFKYRTGLWTLGAAQSLNNGWNFLRVIHTNGIFTRNSNYVEWVIDASTAATTYSSESLSSLNMTGSRFISGIEYFTAGSATYSATINNLYKNTYSATATPIIHPGATNVSISASGIDPISVSETETQIVSKLATITAVKLIKGAISNNTQADRTVQSDVISSGMSIASILMDSTADDATDLNQSLNGEKYRVGSQKTLSDLSGYTSGGNIALWDPSNSLVGPDVNYNNGLLIYDGLLVYPTKTVGIINGNFTGLGPGANPNYSLASGTRVAIFYFFVGSAKQNFTINIVATGTTFVASNVGFNTTNVHLEMLAPNTTQNGSTTLEYKDTQRNFTTIDDIGCRASTFGATNPSAMGITLGSRSTATSASTILLKISASSAWTGSISNISLVVN